MSYRYLLMMVSMCYGFMNAHTPAEEQVSVELATLVTQELAKVQTVLMHSADYMAPEQRQQTRALVVQFLDEYKQCLNMNPAHWKPVVNAFSHVVENVKKLLHDKKFYAARTVGAVLKTSGYRAIKQKMVRAHELFRKVTAQQYKNLPLMKATVQAVDEYMTTMIIKIAHIIDKHAEGLQFAADEANFLAYEGKVLNEQLEYMHYVTENFVEMQLSAKPYIEQLVDAVKDVIDDDASCDVLYKILMDYKNTHMITVVESTPALDALWEAYAYFIHYCTYTMSYSASSTAYLDVH